MFIVFIVSGKNGKIKDSNSSWVAVYYSDTWEAFPSNFSPRIESCPRWPLQLSKQRPDHVVQICICFFNRCTWRVEVVTQGRSNFIVIDQGKNYPWPVGQHCGISLVPLLLEVSRKLCPRQGKKQWATLSRGAIYRLQSWGYMSS